VASDSQFQGLVFPLPRTTELIITQNLMIKMIKAINQLLANQRADPA